MFLKSMGYEPDLVANGREAIEAIEARSYDIILMDVQMPEIDGLEATRCIREQHGPEMPRIIALTASVGAEDQQLCLDAGMDAHLSRPYNPKIS